MAPQDRISPESLRAIRQHTSAFATDATNRIEQQHAWFARLSAEDRSWISVLAHTGISSYLGWLENPVEHPADAMDIFDNAPPELARKISLEHTLDLIRTVIQVVEDKAPALAQSDDAAAIRQSVMRYSREVAFAAARVYARAAEARGDWDARLESLVVDAVVRGEADESLGSRVGALGWADVERVCVVVGPTPTGHETGVVDPLRRAARHAQLELLVSIEGRRMIVILGSVGTSGVAAAQQLVDYFGPGPVVVGPVVPHLYAAGRSARAATSGFEAAPAVDNVPRPVAHEELLAARAVAGDDSARRTLAAMASEHLARGDALGDTARAFLAHRSLEATARALFVHPNTVRYRLGRISELTGYDLTNADDAFAVRLAVMLGDLRTSRRPARLRGSGATPSREERAEKL